MSGYLRDMSVRSEELLDDKAPRRLLEGNYEIFVPVIITSPQPDPAQSLRQYAAPSWVL
jgi:hypothetical protein